MSWAWLFFNIFIHSACNFFHWFREKRVYIDPDMRFGFARYGMQKFRICHTETSPTVYMIQRIRSSYWSWFHIGCLRRYEFHITHERLIEVEITRYEITAHAQNKTTFLVYPAYIVSVSGTVFAVVIQKLILFDSLGQIFRTSYSATKWWTK